jgi:hypothetical protein
VEEREDAVDAFLLAVFGQCRVLFAGEFDGDEFVAELLVQGVEPRSDGWVSGESQAEYWATCGCFGLVVRPREELQLCRDTLAAL